MYWENVIICYYQFTINIQTDQNITLKASENIILHQVYDAWLNKKFQVVYARIMAKLFICDISFGAVNLKCDQDRDFTKSEQFIYNS